MGDELEHLSKKTRERAFIFARNARSIGLTLGSVRFTPRYDYMSYWLTNGEDYTIIFCTPTAYLVEMWTDGPEGIETSFFCIKNIRHFIQKLKSLKYEDVDLSTKDTNDEDLDGETDLRDWVEDLDEQSD